MDFMDGGYLQQRVVFGYPAYSAGYSCFCGILAARRTHAEEMFAVSPSLGVFEGGGKTRVGGERWNILGVWC